MPDVNKHVVMVGPGDTDEQERRSKCGVMRPLLSHRVQQTCLRFGFRQLGSQQRCGYSENSIAKIFESIGWSMIMHKKCLIKGNIQNHEWNDRIRDDPSIGVSNPYLLCVLASCFIIERPMVL